MWIINTTYLCLVLAVLCSLVVLRVRLASLHTWQHQWMNGSTKAISYHVQLSKCSPFICRSWFSLEQNCWFIEDKLSSTAVDFIRSEGIAERQHLIWGKASSLSMPYKQGFLQYINSVDPAIKFTVEDNKEDGSIPFLDTIVKPEVNGSLSITVYRKPTHTD